MTTSGDSGADDRHRIAAGYRFFAEQEAQGRSPLYVELAQGVAGDSEVLAWIAALPAGKRQPNLVFASVRHLCGTPVGFADFRRTLLGHADEVRDVALTHRTQTNEPARCATLLPALARLPQPLALLEIGASAGLCLLPDRYAYDYDGTRIGDAELVLSCRTRGPVPIPDRVPEVVWRAGLDLDPIDVRDAEQVQWLHTLVWPGEEHRLERLDRALAVAAQDPPPVHRGDLRTDLAALAASAPADATLVVFHSAVVSYVAREERGQVVEDIRRTGAVWIANEGPEVLSDVCGPSPQGRPGGAFLLSLDGTPQAWTDGHGEWVHWLA